MTGGVGQAHLDALYARTDDPWHFRTSAYEQGKFEATVAALARPAYGHALELGCGNGELALRIAPRCEAYTGIDAAARALRAAQNAVPRGRFVQRFLPCDLPADTYDLIVLSEILYFLNGHGIAALARQIGARWPEAELLVVTWLGPSGNPLQGEEALAAFISAARPARSFVEVCATKDYRIDRSEPQC